MDWRYGQASIRGGDPMAGRRLTAVGVLAAVAAVAMSASALAKPQPGDLDRSFAGNGIVRTHVDGMDGGSTSVAIDRSHRIVAAGTTNLGAPNASGFLLARYKPSGKLDPSFSGDGMRSVAFPDLDSSDRAVALGKGGAVTVAGVTCPRFRECKFAVARLTPNGELDRGFGEAGKVTVQLGRAEAEGISMAIDSSGRAVIAGTTLRSSGGAFALMRLKNDGELDPRFGNDGRVATRVDPDSPVARLGGMAIDSRDRIIAAGDASRDRVALVRYAKDGDRNRSFGHSGIAVKNLDRLGGIDAIAITPRDKIVAAGPYRPNFGRKWVLARFGREGGLNSSFGDRGEAAIDIPGPGNAEPNAVALDPRNRIVATGRPEFSIARFQPNGNLNRSFGHRGTVTKDLNALAESVTIDSRNRPVVAGDGGTRFVVARFIG
jgi:uncharacterized delta-60 repeat protein